MTTNWKIALRNGFLMSGILFLSNLIALGRFPNSFEIYSIFLSSSMVLLIELANCFGIRLNRNKKTQVNPIFFNK